MTIAPEHFTDQLKREFDDRVRIRWSAAREEWHLEYRVSRAMDPNMWHDERDDASVRARDGYGFIMAVRTGDRMPCPTCNATIKVPVLKTAYAVCDYCEYKGRNGKHPAAYYELNDRLIQHLRMLDPLGSYRNGIARMIKAQNERVRAENQREFKREIEAITLDQFGRMVGIPQFGYTKVAPGTQLKGFTLTDAA